MVSNKEIAQLTRALGLLKSAKLEYLKTAEGQHSTEVQRFLHRQVRLRHHFFQDLEVKLRALAPNKQGIHFAAAQMEHRFVSSMSDTLTKDYENCMEIDSKIIETLGSLEEIEIDTQQLLIQLREAQKSLVNFQNKRSLKSDSLF